jgi:hypothetical protein
MFNMFKHLRYPFLLRFTSGVEMETLRFCFTHLMKFAFWPGGFGGSYFYRSYYLISVKHHKVKISKDTDCAFFMKNCKDYKWNKKSNLKSCLISLKIVSIMYCNNKQEAQGPHHSPESYWLHISHLNTWKVIFLYCGPNCSRTLTLTTWYSIRSPCK